MSSTRARVSSLAALIALTLACGSSSGGSSHPQADGGGGGGADAGNTLPDGGHSGDQDAGSQNDAGHVPMPGTFMLQQPENGDSSAEAMPTLSWSSASDAASYTVQVAKDDSFASPVVDKAGVTDTSLKLDSALSPGLVYYWRVTAVNASGSKVAGNGPFWLSVPVDVGGNPHGVAVTPDGKTAVVTNTGAPGGITFVDLTTFATTHTSFEGQASSQPGSVAITPDGATALVAQLNNVLFVDIASKAVTGSFTSPCAGTTLYGVAVTPDGSSLVLPDFNGGCVNDVLDIVALPGAALNSLAIGTSATSFGVAVTTDGKSALITRGVTATSMRRVPLDGSTVITIANTSSTYGVAVTPDGTTALATSGEGDTVKLISLADNTVSGSIDYASNTDVNNIAISADGKTAVVVGDFDVGILSVTDKSVIRKLSAAGRSVAIAPDGKRAFFTGAGASGTLHVIALP